MKRLFLLLLFAVLHAYSQNNSHKFLHVEVYNDSLFSNGGIINSANIEIYASKKKLTEKEPHLFFLENGKKLGNLKYRSTDRSMCLI